MHAGVSDRLARDGEDFVRDSRPSRSTPTAATFEESGASSPVALENRMPSNLYSPDALPIQIQPSWVCAIDVIPAGAPSRAVQLVCSRPMTGARSWAAVAAGVADRAGTAVGTRTATQAANMTRFEMRMVPV
jgi:hypothetical protein